MDIRRVIEIDDIKVEILTREESTKYLGQMITFQQQETTKIRNRIRAWATFHKYRQELTSRKLHAQTSTPAVRRRGNPDDELCIWNMDTHKRARENDAINATQNAPTHHKNERRYKKIEKRKEETNEENDTDDLGSTGDESEDGRSSNTHNDQDSDVSFENDTDEEIDITVIEEEDWIEYIKRSTDGAMEKIEHAKIRCWNETHKRIIGDWR